MKAIHWRIKVTYNFKKNNQKVNLGQHPLACKPASPDIAILKDRFLKKKKKRQKKKKKKIRSSMIRS